MNKLTTTVAAVALLSSATYVVAQNQLETTLDLAVRAMMDEGTDVSYSDRIISANGGVEYKDVVISAPDGEMVISMDWLKGTPEKGRGDEVTFTVSDTVAFSGNDSGETFSFEMQTKGFELTTNGVLRDAMSTDDVTVTFGADSFIVKGGEADSAILRDLFIDLGAIDFSLLVSEENMYVEGGFTAEQATTVMDYTMDGMTQTTDATSEAFSFTFNADIAEDMEGAMGYLDGSKSATLVFNAGSSEGTGSYDGDGMAITYAGTAGPQDLILQMIDGTLTYDVVLGAMDYTITPGAGIPFPPAEISLGELGMRFVVPAGASEAPAEMIVELLLQDLILGEGLWSMIDPEQTISRNPALIDIQLSALVEFDAMAAMSGADPMEAGKIHSLDVNQFIISAAGASIMADGAMTFDNTGPFPMPLGGVMLDINGLTNLGNQLVALGLLDQMQVGMGLGMMMAFAKPGGNEDQFISEIEFSEDGITANGMPLQ